MAEKKKTGRGTSAGKKNTAKSGGSTKKKTPPKNTAKKTTAKSSGKSTAKSRKASAKKAAEQPLEPIVIQRPPEVKTADKSAVVKGKATEKKREAAAKEEELRRAMEEEREANRRMYMGLVLFIFALFGALGYFNTDALLLNWFRTLCSGLFGVGYYFVPPALAFAGVILVAFKKNYGPLRIASICGIPVLLGALFHLAGATESYPDSLLACISMLWQNGVYMDSGGVFSGGAAKLLSDAISKPGAVILLLIALFLVGLRAANRSIAQLANQLRTSAEKFREHREEMELQRMEELAEQDRRREEAIARGEDPDEYDDYDDYDDDDRGGLFRTICSDEKYKSHRYRDEDELDEPEDDSEDDYDDYYFIEEEELEEEPQPVKKKPAKKSKPVKKSQPAPEEEQPDPELPEVGPAPAVLSGPVIIDIPGPDDPFTIEPTPAPVVVPEPEPVVFESVNQEPVPESVEPEPEPIRPVVNRSQVHRTQRYTVPPLELLEKGNVIEADPTEELEDTQSALDETLRSFGIKVSFGKATRGPAVTRFEVTLERGTRLNKLTNLSEDIELSLGVSGIRIAPIPRKPNAVGIEIPNMNVTAVPVRSVLASKEFRESSSRISFALGKNIGGKCVIGDIAKLPHLLIAGTTGSGKSVCINTLLLSLLYKSGPDELQLIMVDPKKVELGIYNGIPHLKMPVVTEAKKAAAALQWAVVEMMRRYEVFSELGIRNLSQYNRQIDSMAAVADEGDKPMEKLPLIVIVIDELADLMMVASKEVEEAICRIAQLGRAAGIHLVVATQRPSADVITGLIKANIPSRIAFAVASAMESRIILDAAGAEKLVGKGDMLYHPIGANKPTRVQGCLVEDEEVERVVNFIKQQDLQSAQDQSVLEDIARRERELSAKDKKGSSAADEAIGGDYDEMLEAAGDMIVEVKQASTSMVQRKLKVGYARAGRIMDELEEVGLVGPAKGSKPRDLLLDEFAWEDLKKSLRGGGKPQQMSIYDTPAPAAQRAVREDPDFSAAPRRVFDVAVAEEDEMPKDEETAEEEDLSGDDFAQSPFVSEPMPIRRYEGPETEEDLSDIDYAKSPFVSEPVRVHQREPELDEEQPEQPDENGRMSPIEPPAFVRGSVTRKRDAKSELLQDLDEPELLDVAYEAKQEDDLDDDSLILDLLDRNQSSPAPAPQAETVPEPVPEIIAPDEIAADEIAHEQAHDGFIAPAERKPHRRDRFTEFEDYDIPEEPAPETEPEPAPEPVKTEEEPAQELAPSKPSPLLSDFDDAPDDYDDDGFDPLSLVSGYDAEPVNKTLNGDYQLLIDAMNLIVEQGQVSASALQRKLRLRYSETVRLIDDLEAEGFIGPYQGSSPRAVLLTPADWALRRDELISQLPPEPEEPLPEMEIDFEKPRHVEPIDVSALLSEPLEDSTDFE